MSKFLSDAVRKAQQRAIKKKKAFDIDMEWMKRQWKKQNGKCYYTGIKMTAIVGMGRSPYSVSLERLNCNRGYTKRNCVLCCAGMNYALSNYAIEDVVKIMSKFIERYEKKT